MFKDVDSLVQDDLDYIIEKAQDQFQKLAGKTLWFTGAAGFLGYYLCKSIDRWNLNSNKHSQIRLKAIDNFQRGVPDWLIELTSQDIEIVTHDVTDPIPKGWGEPNYIIHGASIASPTFYRKYPLQTVDANVGGLRHMLDFSAEGSDRIEGMLYFSTSEIYGDPPPDAIPTPETFRGLVSCTGPRACYDESKRLGETLCVIFAEEFQVPVRIARPFNNYGPGLKLQDGRVLPDFVRNALEGDDIVLLSDGVPTRTFCYVADALDGYLKVLTHGRSGEPYNIGIDNDEISMADLAESVASKSKALWNYQGRVIKQTSRDSRYLQDNPNRRCPNIDKARAELGYSPEINLDNGLNRTLTWYYFNSAGQGS